MSRTASVIPLIPRGRLRLLGIFLAMTLPASADDLSGQASIIDGDTLEIHGARIRLWGIDAPESDQLCRNDDSEHYRCGQKAANDLDVFIARRRVECVEVDRDQYRRAVAVCTVAGVDLADWLVRNGHALDWPKYSKGDYAAAQDEAKRADRGMWSGSFVEPWRYRACRRMGGSLLGCSDQP
jgi:endonuclease YncB( thermonuclease family)